MPETFGHYTVLNRLGAGALGELYRARDTKSGRTVALRVVAEAVLADADSREGLLAGLQAAEALSHPNIAALYEIGEDRGRPYFALEFVPGETLARLAGGRPMNPRRAIGYATQIADALAEAHASDIEHGHLSALNVIVTPKGNAKILDFGAARWTKAGAAAGRRPDLVALGALLSELVPGGPSAGESVAGPRAEVRLIADGLMDGGRFESAATAAAALRSIAERIDALAPAPMPPAASRVASASNRAPFFWLLGLGVLIGAALLIWAATRL